MKKKKEKGFISVSQMAEELDVSQKMIRHIIGSEQLPYYKFGRLMKVKLQDWEKFKEERRVVK